MTWQEINTKIVEIGEEIRKKQEEIAKLIKLRESLRK